MILTGFIGTSGLVFLSQFVAKSCAKSADRQAKLTARGPAWNGSNSATVKLKVLIRRLSFRQFRLK